MPSSFSIAVCRLWCTSSHLCIQGPAMVVSKSASTCSPYSSAWAAATRDLTSSLMLLICISVRFLAPHSARSGVKSLFWLDRIRTLSFRPWNPFGNSGCCQRRSRLHRMPSVVLGRERCGMRLLRNRIDPRGTSHVTVSASGSTPSVLRISSSDISVYQVPPTQHVWVPARPVLCPARTICMQPFSRVASTRGIQAVSWRTDQHSSSR
mmetsp:Transcript_12882/g.25175  ORF Transcript_12882/g.25175 Transcript_12882/m.25175 type:complete len:208 (-) Transcript_12882:324-947(-)